MNKVPGSGIEVAATTRSSDQQWLKAPYSESAIVASPALVQTTIKE